ncbi:MAG: hypothetical protein JWN56_2460 [Sphingobacteriales bacterium]|nr:hypothetical protein [Sphingobacteriales bacterium]
MKKLLYTFIFSVLFIPFTMAQQRMDKKILINGFYTASMDKLLDSIASQHHLKIVFDRDKLQQHSISDHYFDEPLPNVLASICKATGFHYWLERDGTIYIIKIPEDLAALKKSERLKVAAGVVKSPISRQEKNKEPIEKESHNISPFRVTGKVVDGVTGESLPGAMVRVAYKDLVVTTNADGYFTLLNVPSDTCTLTTTYIGYQTDKVILSSVNYKGAISIGLFTSNNNLDEVVVVGKKSSGVMTSDTRRVSVLQISPAKLAELPNIGEKDILRSFQLMPGISGSNESSSGAYVRGGTPDQNLVLFDGFTVYQVDHLYGFFSAFNSNAVKDVQLYKGGFSAKYGGRLSSVTDISGKEGNKKESNIGGDLSLLSANIYLETPIKDKSTLLLAYRRSYQGPLYDKLFNKFNNTTAATAQPQSNRPGGRGGSRGGAAAVSTPASYFYDLNAKYTYRLNEKDLFSWSIYQGDDNLDNSRKINLPSFLSGSGSGLSLNDKTTYGNLGSSAKWSRQWDNKLYSNTLVSFSTYHSDRDRSNTSTITDTAGVAQEISRGTFEKNKLEDWSVKSDWEWQGLNKAKLLFGTFGSSQNITYEYSQNDTSKLIDQHNKALTLGGYAELEVDPTSQLHFKSGIRSTYYDQTGKLYFEPRFSGTYSLTDRFTLKAATGRFYQFANRVLREDILSGSRDFWVLADGDAIPVGTANHYIAGFSYETNKFLFDVEGYYKSLNGLTEYSQRQTGNRRAISLEEHFYNGKGFTRGIEFLLQKKTGKYTGWLSYTLAEAKNQFDTYSPNYYYASQDTRNEFKSINMYRWRKWAFSATWIYATGKPYTAPVGSYTIDNLTGTSLTYLAISGKNSERMPAYHRLDASATFDLIKIDSHKTGSIGLSLFNIYNRSNTWYKEYNIQDNQVITSDVKYLGFTPNITFSLKWK